jgi:tetratricopeptide (TPR) repeat protein
LSKQDEKLRLRRRLQSQAVEMASRNRWQEAAELNQQLIALGEDTDTLNRLGKALFELNQLPESRDAYQRALKLTPNNPIARKNLDRLDEIIGRSGSNAQPSKAGRQLVDLRLFITETGKTALSSLIDVPRSTAIVTGEKVELRLDGRNVLVIDVEGNLIGRIEPKLAQRLSELMAGGNRYAAAVAQAHGQQIRVLIREVYQAPGQRGRVSFPGKLSEGVARAHLGGAQYDEYGDDILEEEEPTEEREEVEEEAFGGEEEELGLEDIEQDIGEEEDINEE